MTEADIFAAVHEYAAVAYPTGVRAGMPPLDLGDVHVARAKLLEAIREWAGNELVRDALLERAYDILSAKATVCETYRDWLSDPTRANRMSLSGALANLAALEVRILKKEPQL